MAAPRPIKSILKKKRGPTADHRMQTAAAAAADDEDNKKSQKWDEMNILATYHPEGKDYGLMKIDEPNTPYNRMVEDDEDGVTSDCEGYENLTAEILARKLTAVEGAKPKVVDELEDSSEEEEEELTPEEKENRQQFEMKRKIHYNEAMNIKLARQLIAKELAEAEVDEELDEEVYDEEDDEGNAMKGTEDFGGRSSTF